MAVADATEIGFAIMQTLARASVGSMTYADIYAAIRDSRERTREQDILLTHGPDLPYVPELLRYMCNKEMLKRTGKRYALTRKGWDAVMPAVPSSEPPPLLRPADVVQIATTRPETAGEPARAVSETELRRRIDEVRATLHRAVDEACGRLIEAFRLE